MSRGSGFPESHAIMLAVEKSLDRSLISAWDERWQARLPSLAGLNNDPQGRAEQRTGSVGGGRWSSQRPPPFCPSVRAAAPVWGPTALRFALSDVAGITCGSWSTVRRPLYDRGTR